jgi:regulator of sirC expression with transglutaminase-like and TPR domain
MFSSIDFLLAKTAITIAITCYAFFLVKMKSASESSEFSKLLQETHNDLLVQRRTELLSKIKEERITEYSDRRKQKLGG